MMKFIRKTWVVLISAIIVYGFISFGQKSYAVSSGTDTVSENPPAEMNFPGLTPADQLAAQLYPNLSLNDPRRDFYLFRDNVKDHPVISARALLRMFKKMEDAEVQTFIGDNVGNIVKLVISVEGMNISKKIQPDIYKKIMERFGNLGISPQQVMHRGAGAPGGSRAGQSQSGEPEFVNTMVRAVMDVREDFNEDPKATEKGLKNLKEQFPDNSSVLSTVSEYYNELEKYNEAEETASDAIKLNPENTDAYKARAMARVSMEDKKGALEDVKKAMELDPQDESSKILSILIASSKNAPDLKTVASIEAMRDAINAAEESVSDLSGDSSGNSNKLNSAGKLWTEENLKEENSKPVNFGKSKLFLKKAAAKNSLGDYTDAVKYASMAIKEDKGNVNAYLERAMANNFLGHYDKAISDATKALEKDSGNVQALNIRSWALNKKGNFRQAGGDATAAIKLNPNFADAWFNRANANKKMGDYKQMLQDYRQAALLSKNYSSQYRDAVAQYAKNVPGFTYDSSLFQKAKTKSDSGLKKFLILMGFTITGGLLIGFGFMHVASNKMVKAPANGVITQPDELSPDIFYEGVASGKYTIERKIGAGGMGMVYEGLDQTLERKVAIKKMSDEIKLNEREKQRFLQEARMVALLQHPNIVEIYTIFEEDGNVYLVFEYIAGRTLDVILSDEVRMSFERTKNIFEDITKALVYAHSKDIVHRDLKLSNIMIDDEEGFVKVMDFGLARKAMESVARLTNVEIVGSPAYMAPEQDSGDSGKQCDVFALGVCLYEILTGDLPFKGPDFHNQKEQKLYTPVSSIAPAVPEGVDELIAKTLEPEPEKRFKSVEQWYEAFLKIS
ncbi:MAG: protein kinase [Elusimicrobiota bacterium]|nr:protein kinase [Elusimicrobiota bacterium]